MIKNAYCYPFRQKKNWSGIFMENYRDIIEYRDILFFNNNNSRRWENLQKNQYYTKWLQLQALSRKNVKTQLRKSHFKTYHANGKSGINYLETKLLKKHTNENVWLQKK